MPHVRQPGSAILVCASTSAAESSPLFLGFDFGTSGARAVVIDGNAANLLDVKRNGGWRAALFGLLRDIPEELRRRVAAVSLDGTSATTMVVSQSTRKPVPHDVQRGGQPRGRGCRGSSGAGQSHGDSWHVHAVQADDVVVEEEGEVGEKALPSDCIVAFLAARVTTPGYAVTSLGSTLAVKLVVSTARIDDARFGVYSHRLPPGDSAPPGVENEGEAEEEVLRGYFTDEELRKLSAKIDPSVESKLDYYQLTRPGEGFPVSDPDLQPCLTPRPADDALFLHGIRVHSHHRGQGILVIG
ncbi:unnamed protein product [Closterium sp. Yama58-4]|nr:unnamed protein product [Closterium sp. Yama58-4]